MEMDLSTMFISLVKKKVTAHQSDINNDVGSLKQILPIFDKSLIDIITLLFIWECVYINWFSSVHHGFVRLQLSSIHSSTILLLLHHIWAEVKVRKKMEQTQKTDTKKKYQNNFIDGTVFVGIFFFCLIEMQRTHTRCSRLRKAKFK